MMRLIMACLPCDGMSRAIHDTKKGACQRRPQSRVLPALGWYQNLLAEKQRINEREKQLHSLAFHRVATAKRATVEPAHSLVRRVAHGPVMVDIARDRLQRRPTIVAVGIALALGLTVAGP